MKMKNGQFVVYGNALKKSHSREAIKWNEWLAKKFHYNPDEKYTLSVHDKVGSTYRALSSQSDYPFTLAEYKERDIADVMEKPGTKAD